MLFKIEYIASKVIETNPFMIDRPEGSYRYIFFHFLSQITMELNHQIIEASPGSIIIYSPKEKQKFYVNHNRLNHDFIDFQITDENFFKDIKFPLNTLLNPKMSNYITSMVQEIKDEKSSGEIGSVYQNDAKMIELFIAISRKINHRNHINSDIYTNEMKKKFEEMRLDMYQNTDNFSVHKLANSLGFSLSRFNTLYKAYFGITPIKDLTNARIQRVEELLKNGYSTKEIIRKIGFNSEEYFYRWFKLHFHQTKDEYLKGQEK